MKQLIIIFLVALLGLSTSYAAPPEADHPCDEITLSADQSIEDVSFNTLNEVAIAPIRAVDFETEIYDEIDPVLLNVLEQSEVHIRSIDRPPLIYTAGITLPEDLNWASILNVILFIISVTFGGSIVVFRKKGREVANALNTIMNAVEDNNISQKEEQEIVAAIRKIFSK